MEYDAFSSTSNQDLSPCDICGRNFNPTVLQRHIPICEKANLKKRKVFDAAKQRAAGTEIALPKNRPKPGQPPPQQHGAKSNWRAQHEDFVNTIRAARDVTKAMKEGGPLPPPPPPTINPDYVQCPYCTRRFNANAAQRHIDFCKEQQSRLPNKKAISKTTMQRADARKHYSPPKLVKKGGSTLGSGSGYGARTQSGFGAGSAGNYGSTQSSARAQGNQGSAGSTSSYNSYNANRYTDSESPASTGRALRTGRTTETYTEARKLSAKQRTDNPPPRKNPSQSNASSRYGRSGYGGSSSRGGMSPVTGNGYNTYTTDNGYYSAVDSGESHGAKRTAGVGASGGPAKFCHDCGTKYPVAQAKFCCECGLKRVAQM